MEIIFQTKRFRKHAFGIGITALTLAVVGGAVLLLAPARTADAAQALFTSSIQISPTKNGLADINTNSFDEKKLDSDIGSAASAGDHLNLQFEYESSSNR
jgi:hypothetical protein